VIFVYDDVTYVYDDVTYVYDDVAYGPWYEDVQAAKATYDYQANPRPQV